MCVKGRCVPLCEVFTIDFDCPCLIRSVCAVEVEGAVVSEEACSVVSGKKGETVSTTCESGCTIFEEW